MPRSCLSGENLYGLQGCCGPKSIECDDWGGDRMSDLLAPKHTLLAFYLRALLLLTSIAINYLNRVGPRQHQCLKQLASCARA